MLLFLFTGLILTIPADIYRFSQVRKIVAQLNHNQLESVSEAKEIHLHDLVEKKYEAIQALGDDIISIVNPQSGKFCEDASCSALVLSSIERYQTRMSRLVKSVTIADISGKTVVSTDEKISKGKEVNPDLTKAVLKSGKVLDGIQKLDNELVVFVGYLMSVNNRPVGILVMELLADDFISLTNDYTGLGKTGETYLAVKNGNQINFISPVRYNRNINSNPSVSLSDTNFSIVKPFLKGKGGFCVDCIDYRRIPVISSYRYIDELNWGMVTEIDQAEMYEPVYKIRNIFIVIFTIILVVILLNAFFFSQYLSKPLEKLIVVVNRFRNGDYKARSDIHLKNETGILSESFNQMADTIGNNLVRLNQSNQELNRFGYVVSHDLKAPVQSIIALAGMLSESADSNTDSEEKQILSMIMEKCNQMQEMIDTVLNAARTGSQGEKQELDSGAVVKIAVQNILVPDHIKITVEPNLTSVIYNKTSMLQVFQNLISNAVKYNDKPVGIVQIGFDEFQDKFCFWVKDNGRGIRESEFNKIFNIFTRVNEDSGIESSGIGLSTVKKIVTENNGEVWVKSDVNIGSVFYFTIPKA
jgi:signal transduction histidine kinase